MAEDMPYMASVSNLTDILTKIRGAGSPPRFTHEFLSATLGFRSSNDRGVIKVLKSLGMLAADGAPTARYNRFKSESTGGAAMAEGLREGWADVFLADTQAHERTASELQDIFKTVTGKGDAVARKMATTFKALTQHADFAAPPPAADPVDTETEDTAPKPGEQIDTVNGESLDAATWGLSLRHDVHIHLPPTSDSAVYTAIFRALREELLE